MNYDAQEINEILQPVRWTPVKANDVQQKNLGVVTGDVFIKGNKIRLLGNGPAIGSCSRGMGRWCRECCQHGNLTGDLYVRLFGGEVRILPAGSSVEIPDQDYVDKTPGKAFVG